MKKNILINLDGYQHITLTNPLKKILSEGKNNYAFHCANVKDKNLIKKNFKSFNNIFCNEDFFIKNFTKINLDKYEKIIEKLNLDLNEIDRGFNLYSKYYVRPFLSKDKKNEISKKRIILNYEFYLELFKEFKPEIIIHEHSGGVGSSILWQLCKMYDCKYFFFKGLYFKKKFFFLNHKDFSNPYFDSNKITQYPKIEIDNFKNEINKANDISPYEKQTKQYQKINLQKTIINFLKRAKKYYSSSSEINYYYNRFPPILDNIIYNYITKLRKFYFNFFLQDKIDLSKKYVAVYLQVEPELSTYSLNNKDISFINLIKILSKLLPDDYKIYVKEHPSQSINSRFRSLDFFYKLKKINKVKLCPINFNSLELMKKSRFITTGGGTIVFESIVNNIPSIVFGKNFYLNFKTIFPIKNLSEIKDTIKKINLYKLNIFENENENENINYALNIKNSMLDGYLFLSKDTPIDEIKKNDELIYQSLNKFFSFI